MLNNNLCMKVELSISCTNLPNLDLTSLSDPICMVEIKTNGKFHEVGRTERIKESLNPVFSTRIRLDYKFEEVQDMRFKIFDADNSTQTLDDDDFIGKCKLTLGQIVSSKTKVVDLLKKKKTTGGKITISAEEISDNLVSHFKFKAVGLDNKDFLGKSDPFLELWRENNNDWNLCYRSEVVKNELNPFWKGFKVPHYLLSHPEHDRKIKFICYDADGDGSHDLIGECETTYKQLHHDKTNFPLINPKKLKKKKNYNNSGSLILLSCQIKKEASFLDFLFGGLQLNFTVGIDFTGSNGDPRSSDSLHYLRHDRLNEYQQSLYSVGNIIQDYDYDKLFPAFGFGAHLPSGKTSHEFALNFQPDNPYCQGIHGIGEAYKQVFQHIRLSGPTCISPIINHVARFASKQTSAASNYFVLLLITDGVITDMDETKHAIVTSSNYPMSIIIIGVGHADFSGMRELDGDEGRLKSPLSGAKASRDIVQFVPFSRYKNQTSQELARVVLAELPQQVTGYYEMNGIEPQHQRTA